jgi:hypothetical protein
MSDRARVFTGDRDEIGGESSEDPCVEREERGCLEFARERKFRAHVALPRRWVGGRVASEPA